MNPLEQNTAIALALGYTYEDRAITYDGAEIKFRLWQTPGGGGMERSWPPNYPGDLNAMHEAEKSLPLKKQMQYQGMIGKVTGNKCPALFGQIHSTAAQRAEAFLRTLNLWKP
jgi:hypothetical protein